jgi:hypothetical protein
MENNFEKVKYVDGVAMVLRGVFFGEPAYSRATSLSSYVPAPITDPQATAIVIHESIN